MNMHLKITFYTLIQHYLLVNDLSTVKIILSEWFEGYEGGFKKHL